MNVLLLNPPSVGVEPISRGLMGGFGMRVGPDLVYPPIQLAQLAAVLEQAGHRVSIHDAEALGETLSVVVAHVVASGAEIVAMPCSQDAFDWELALCRALAKDTRVCLFGPMAGHHADRCLEQGMAEWVILGEPDFALAELLTGVDRGDDPSIDGLVFRRDDEIHRRPGSNRVSDLNELPIPAYHLLDSSLYRYPGDSRPMTIVHGSRGCPIGCPFCAYMVTEGRRWRARSVAHLMAEIAHAHQGFGIELFVFRDPVFTLDRDRTIRLCQALKDASWTVDWICETALSCVDEELLVAMRSAGCIGLSFGVESGNESLQRKYAKNKIRSHAHAASVVESCRRLGIRTRGFFMMGFPEETAAMRRETVDLAVRLDPDTVQFVPLTLYAGTPLFEELAGSGATEGILDPAIEQSIRSAYRRFYGRPSRLLQELRAPSDLFRKGRRYLTSAAGSRPS